MSDSTTHFPTGAWRFDDGVTSVFDDMISRSIPQHEVMRDAMTSLGRPFLREGSGRLLDLGCSTGLSIASLLPDVRSAIGIEVSEPMVRAARERFAADGRIQILQRDLTEDFELSPEPVDLVMSVYTLQFIPPGYRAQVLRKALLALRPGGALIVSEKLRGSTPAVDGMLVREYHALKERNGYSREAIEAKAKSLEGVLVPWTADHVGEALRLAGFEHIECFWRWMNFAAWIAIR